MAQQAHAPALHTQKMLGQTHAIAWPALRAVGALLASCGDGKVLCLSAHGIIACGVGLYTVAWQAKTLGQRWSHREKVQCLDKFGRARPLLEASGIPS